MYSNMIGRSIESNAWDKDFINSYLNNLATTNWYNLDNVRSDMAHSERVVQKVEATYTSMVGWSMTDTSWDKDFVNHYINLMATNDWWNLVNVRSDMAHNERVVQRVEATYTSMVGRSMQDNSWDHDFINSYTDRMATNDWYNLDNVSSDMAHSERIIGVLKNKFSQLKGHSFNVNNSNDANWLSWAQQQLINGTNVNNLS